MVALPKLITPKSGPNHVVDPSYFQDIDLTKESAWWSGLELKSFDIGGVHIPNRYLLAPMCDVTNLPYRIIARASGASLLATEMLSSVAMAMGGNKTLQMMEFLPSEDPIMVQISGTAPDVMLKASEMIQDYGASILNLNCGCPVKKVIKGGSGSALLRDPEVLRGIIRTLRPAVHIPLTVKLRAGWDANSVNAVEVAKMCEDEGIDSVMLHGRTRSQMYEGNANWDLIGQVKQAVSIPVIGNGDIFTGEDAHRMLEHTGCDGVMIARGAIGNPWIFRECIAEELKARGESSQTLNALPTPRPSMEDRYETIMRHFNLFSAYAGEDRALVQLRKQIMAYAKGLPGASAFRANLARFTARETLEGCLQDFLLRDHSDEGAS
jgi:nifR3 family TIM-barrel protein